MIVKAVLGDLPLCSVICSFDGFTLLEITFHPTKSPFSSFVINLSFYARETCMAGFGKSYTSPSLHVLLSD